MTLLEELSAELERATDAYTVACNANAHAENLYLNRMHKAFASLVMEPATTRLKRAEGMAVDERCAWNLTAATERACRAKVNELQSRLVAAQSDLKHHGRQDGGAW